MFTKHDDGIAEIYVDPIRSPVMQEQFDAILYLGPPPGLTCSQLSPALSSDPEYIKMRSENSHGPAWATVANASTSVQFDSRRIPSSYSSVGCEREEHFVDEVGDSVERPKLAAHRRLPPSAPCTDDSTITAGYRSSPDMLEPAHKCGILNTMPRQTSCFVMQPTWAADGTRRYTDHY